MRVADLEARPASLEDAALAADVMTALDPDDPIDPLINRYQWKTAPPWPRERFVLESRGRPVGFAFHAHVPWEEMPERFAFVGAFLAPADDTPERADAAWDLVEGRSRDDGARTFSVWAKETQASVIEALLRRGYKEERRGTLWELDIAANREKLAAMAEASRRRMREEGITILTLADDADPDAEPKLWRLVVDSVRDIPTTVPIVMPPFEQWRKWLSKPGVHRDRVWIARHGGEIVGVSVLSYPPVRGNVWTDYTGTAQSVRGRGVARALKLETVQQAVALGITRVRTGNDSENAPILHLNEEMGYKVIPAGIQFLKAA
jgi:RimJ/RimL family protein N-acetyltransferase